MMILCVYLSFPVYLIPPTMFFRLSLSSSSVGPSACLWAPSPTLFCTPLRIRHVSLDHCPPHIFLPLLCPETSSGQDLIKLSPHPSLGIQSPPETHSCSVFLVLSWAGGRRGLQTTTYFTHGPRASYPGFLGPSIKMGPAPLTS